MSTTFVSSDNPIGDSGGRGGGGVVVLVRATSMKWPATKTSTGPDSRWVQKAVRRGEIINSGERGAYTSIWPLATSSCPFYMLTPDDTFYVFVIGAWNLLGENLRLARKQGKKKKMVTKKKKKRRNTNLLLDDISVYMLVLNFKLAGYTG